MRIIEDRNGKTADRERKKVKKWKNMFAVPAVGDPDNGIAPGTAFEDLPEDWGCPVCGVGKEEFEKQ